MLNAKTLFFATREERNKLIFRSQSSHINSLSELERAKALSLLVNSFVIDFIDIQIEHDSKQSAGSVLSSKNLKFALTEIVEQYKSTIIPELLSLIEDQTIGSQTSKNIFEMFGATKLASANKVSRVLSTKLGLLWERFAEVSPYTVDTQKEFAITIKGIDLISKNIRTEEIEYLQIKTQKNTLTGSQKSRSVAELKIHENSVFCVCFNNGASWTFSQNSGVKRVCGENFWKRIGISYDIVLEVAKELVLELESVYTG